MLPFNPPTSPKKIRHLLGMVRASRAFCCVILFGVIWEAFKFHGAPSLVQAQLLIVLLAALALGAFVEGHYLAKLTLATMTQLMYEIGKNRKKENSNAR